MTARKPGMYGRRYRDPEDSRPYLPLAEILSGALPTVPLAADYMTDLDPGWLMLGNDVAGDCVAVTWANLRRLTTAVLSVENYPTQDQVWEVYRTQNPDFDPAGTAMTNGPGSYTDRGMDIQQALGYLHKVGGPDGVKVLAFAKVDQSNPVEVKTAIAIFGAVWTGLNVQAVNESQFAQGRPWGYSDTSPLVGGHSVITAGYGPPGKGPLGGDERFETWAQETSFTDGFWQNNVQEAWVVIFPEHLTARSFLEGVNGTALAGAYTALTGRPFPAVIPPPPPPDPDLEAFAAVAKPWAAKTRTREDLVELQAAIRALFKKKGL